MGYKLNKTVILKFLLEKFNINFNNNDVFITGVSSLNNYEENTLIFSNREGSVPDGAIVISEYFYDNAISIYSNHPRALFIELLIWLKKNIGFDLYSQESLIDSSISIGKNVLIESGCIIGKNVIIENNVIISKGTYIGDNCIISSGVSIGNIGFGFERINGKNCRFPHLGRVIIGNDVEIGVNSSISRGTLSDTIVGDDVKIGNLVHISHNVKIGYRTMIASCVEISGSVELGSDVWVGPNSCIKQKLKIGNNVTIGIGSVVVKSVNSGLTIKGNPAY